MDIKMWMEKCIHVRKIRKQKKWTWMTGKNIEKSYIQVIIHSISEFVFFRQTIIDNILLK